MLTCMCVRARTHTCTRTHRHVHAHTHTHPPPKWAHREGGRTTKRNSREAALGWVHHECGLFKSTQAMLRRGHVYPRVRGREACRWGPNPSEDQGTPDPRLGWCMDPSQKRQAS